MKQYQVTITSEYHFFVAKVWALSSDIAIGLAFTLIADKVPSMGKHLQQSQVLDLTVALESNAHQEFESFGADSPEEARVHYVGENLTHWQRYDDSQDPPC